MLCEGSGSSRAATVPEPPWRHAAPAQAREGSPGPRAPARPRPRLRGATAEGHVHWQEHSGQVGARTSSLGNNISRARGHGDMADDGT